jgi:hypothetical protein
MILIFHVEFGMRGAEQGMLPLKKFCSLISDILDRFQIIAWQDLMGLQRLSAPE